MSDDKTIRTPQDASRVNVHEAYEVEYWTRKWGIDRARLEQAVAKVGPMAADVEKELKG